MKFKESAANIIHISKGITLSDISNNMPDLKVKTFEECVEVHFVERNRTTTVKFGGKTVTVRALEEDPFIKQQGFLLAWFILTSNLSKKRAKVFLEQFPNYEIIKEQEKQDDPFNPF